MIMQQNTVVVGVFEEQNQARNTVDELQRAGYRDNKINFLPHDDVVENEDDKFVNVRTSIVGGTLGCILGAMGAISTLFIPSVGQHLFGGILLAMPSFAIVGALIGNTIGTLTSAGSSAQKVHFYSRERKKGRSIVLVKLTADYEHICRIMNRNGALKCQYWAG